MSTLNQMPLELRIKLERDINARIPQEWVQKRYHWCDDWDGLLVGPDDPEMQACCCDLSWLKH